MRILIIGDVVSRAEIDASSQNMVGYGDELYPAWEVETGEDESIGSSLWLVCRDYLPDDGGHFTADVHCCKVSDGVWVVVDIAMGYVSLKEYAESRQADKVAEIQEVMDTYASGLVAREWLVEKGVLR